MRKITVTTSKVKCNGSNPKKEFSHYVEMSDGNISIGFVSDGSDKLTLKDFASGVNAAGHKYWAHRDEPGKLHAMYSFGRPKNRKAEINEILELITVCLAIPIRFTEGSLMYEACIG